LTEASRRRHPRLLAWSHAHGYPGGMSGKGFRRWFNRAAEARLPNMPVDEFLRRACGAVGL
jgi:hypothetical protein